MRMPLTLAIGIWCLTLGSPGSTPAAPNPDLDALSQGSVVQFTGTEHISQPYEFDLEMMVPNPALNFDHIVGQPVHITVTRGRSVTGMVERIEQIGVAGRKGQYSIRLVPTLKRLGYRNASRTFEEVTPVQIVNALLNEAGMSGVDARFSTSLPLRDLIMQYQETDLAFFSRLLADEGIHYHFEQTASGDKIVLGDTNTAFPVLSSGKLMFGPGKGSSISTFSRGQSVHSGNVHASDFNWRTPQVNLTGTAQTTKFADLREEVNPASANTPQESQRIANLRLAARISDGETCGGESTYPHLQPGFRFLLIGHPRQDFHQEYVITGVEHRGTLKSYRNTFTCIPAHVIVRPSPTSFRPVMTGVVPGLVVGPQGEIKHVDQFGRVRVRFPWRNPAFSNKTAGDAGWVRVAQLATGQGTSAMWIPEIDDEVLVAFEHGDLNRPVIIGSMWNGKDLPPSSQPANKFLSLFQNRSITGTVTEILFDATQDQERLMLRSGNQFLSLSPTGITASSEIQTQSPALRKLQPSPGMRTPTLPGRP